mgnify:FL=1
MALLIRNPLATTMLVTLILTVAPWQGAQAEPGLSPQTLKELAQVRLATARYHNIHNAMADGYVDANFVAPGIGCHMINFAYAFDGAIDLEKPELLVYADCSGAARGRSELRAVEYSLICPLTDCSGTPIPEGFTGDNDAWEFFEAVGNIPSQWTLHAWVWRHNPSGIFVKVNPSLD